MARRRRNSSGGRVEDYSRTDVQRMYDDMERDARRLGTDASSINRKNLEKRQSVGRKVG